MSAPPTPTLECGQDVLDLVEQVSDGTPAADPAHQASCPYCQDALARLRGQTDRLRELADEPVEVPRGLRQRIKAQVRRERGQIVIAQHAAGRDVASDLVITQIARRAAQTIPGVLQCSVTISPSSPGGLILDVHLTAVLGPPLPPLADAVRDAIVADLAALTGLAAQLSITIDDVELPS